MKWIKATDRRPDIWDNVTIRVVGKKTPIVRVNPAKNDCPEQFVLPIIGQYEYIEYIEWLDESTEEIKKAIEQVQDLHPYKQSGDSNSYSNYNEGWSDACDIILDKLTNQS